jgi:DNA invertase Pin-like site-specific DNA recombinase
MRTTTAGIAQIKSPSRRYGIFGETSGLTDLPTFNSTTSRERIWGREEQRQTSIDDQIASRPGINQVWAGIVAHRWDLIIAEESSRLYRHHTKAGELFESAVDADIRIICPSDSIDTLDDDWPDRLHMCQMQHARSNFYTRL